MRQRSISHTYLVLLSQKTFTSNDNMLKVIAVKKINSENSKGNPPYLC